MGRRKQKVQSLKNTIKRKKKKLSHMGWKVTNVKEESRIRGKTYGLFPAKTVRRTERKKGQGFVKKDQAPVG